VCHIEFEQEFVKIRTINKSVNGKFIKNRKKTLKMIQKSEKKINEKCNVYDEQLCKIA